MNKETLLIPQGLRQNSEIFDGFGKSELLISIIVSVTSVIIALIAYSITQSVVGCVVFVLVMVVGSVMSLVRDRNNISIVKQVQLLIRFWKSQKRYPYKSRSVCRR